jgi:hypothetical protein
MTSNIFNLKSEPFQPVAAAQAAARIPGQLVVVPTSSPDEIVARRMRARERLRNAIALYRDAFGANRLDAVLVKAAEDELHLVESGR